MNWKAARKKKSGVVFLAEIFRSFRRPTFDSNLLILMGISGVTYVGFKFNEKT